MPCDFLLPAITKTDTEQKKDVLYIFSAENYIYRVRLWSTGEGCLSNRSQRPQPCDLHGEDLERIAKCGTADPKEGSASEQSEGERPKSLYIERKWRNLS